ncbi:SspB family protein [Profundibacter sp.]
MSDTIDYGNLMHRAMRTLIKEVLSDIAKTGLPGQHHFFITFDTMHPDVEIADWLSDRYPGDMTIVIQHWFDNLDVTDVGFAITLNFGDNPEPLYIPYDAIVTFVDPSVEFGLRFDSKDDEEQDAEVVSIETAEHEEVPEAPMVEATEDDAPPKDAEIFSLDSFRK